KTSMKGIPFMLVLLKSFFFSLPATGVDAGGGSSSAAAPGVFPLVPPVAVGGSAAPGVFPFVPPLAALGMALPAAVFPVVPPVAAGGSAATGVRAAACGPVGKTGIAADGTCNTF
ncbi:MAG: hypothetical protein ACT6RN_27310, partial [Agrobacterium sp.]|uniref:hypothetical protein n=1 Tax=Agrobacterium sp. TaxID=361 RepID=UPI0040377B2C